MIRGHNASQEAKVTHLKTIIRCPLLETGYTRSRYMVKLSSRHRISGALEPPGEEGEEKPVCAGAWTADATMPHIGQPDFGEKAMSLCAGRTASRRGEGG